MLFALFIALVLFVVAVGIIGFTLHLLWLLAIGLVIGMCARLVIPGRQAVGILATTLYGIAGAFGGDLIARSFNGGTVIQFILSVVVAALLLMLVGGTYDAAHINRRRGLL